MAAIHAATASALTAPCKLQVLPEAVLQRVLQAEAQQDAIMASAGAPRRLLDLLRQQSLLSDALRFLAHALPAREAVWWGCMCAAATLPADAPMPERHALMAAEAWVRQPQAAGTTANAVAAAQACLGAPGAWPGLAIQWGALRAAAGARAIEGGVLRAVQRHAFGQYGPGADPNTQAAIMARFLASGMAISCGQSGRIGSLAPPEQQHRAADTSA